MAKQARDMKSCFEDTDINFERILEKLKDVDFNRGIFDKSDINRDKAKAILKEASKLI